MCKVGDIMSENIDKEFILQYEVIENGWIKTLEGIIYTENDITRESALEVYERVLREKENPPTPVPTLEEVVEEQGNKISILTNTVNNQNNEIDSLKQENADIYFELMMLSENI